MWDWPLERGAYFAPHDTQFCLYRAGAPRTPSEAVRTSFPYMARHMAFYVDFENMSEEQVFYASRAVQSTPDSPETAHWAFPELPAYNAPRERPQLTSVQRANTTLRWRLRGRRTIRRPEPWSVDG
jgi:hypothetical protein